jgi:hypothetical protein
MGLPIAVVQSNSSFAGLNDRLWCPLGLFLKCIENHYGVIIDAIDDSPGAVFIIHPEFVATWTNAGHRARPRHAEAFTLLESSKQKPGFESGSGRKWRSLNLAMEPD